MGHEAVYHDLPALETERLLLRKVTMADAQDVFEYASDPEVTRYLTWETHPNLQHTKAYLQTVLDRYEKDRTGPWGIVLKSERKLIGAIDVRVRDEASARADFGYVLNRQYWNQGYMTEALRAVLRYGFERLRLNRMEATCDPRNTGSWRVMEKAGMQFEGVMRQHLRRRGVLSDSRLYAILRDDWLAAHGS